MFTECRGETLCTELNNSLLLYILIQQKTSLFSFNRLYVSSRFKVSQTLTDN